MKLSEVCIRRPVLTIVISLVLIFLGILGFSQLTTRFAPYYFRPHLTVMVTYPGASSEAVEMNVTQLLENALNGTPGLTQIFSQSRTGTSQISLSFKDLTQQQFVVAQSQVLQEIASVKLPQNAQQPRIFQGNAGSWTYLVAITDPNMSAVELNNYVNNILATRIATVSGVGNIMHWTDTSTLYIALNPAKMAALGITPTQVTTALENNNQNLPAGQVITNQQYIQVNADLTLSDVSDFKNLVISNSNGRLITLGDISTIKVDASLTSGGFTEVNGENAGALMISASDDANPIQVSDDLTRLLKNVSASFPPGMQYHVLFNIGEPLKEAVNDVYHTIGIAIILVICVSFMFLGNLRTTLIPVVTIPICLISSFAVMLLLGFTINVMTLLAFVLGVGLVVDDAIVVLENCVRHIEHGLAPLDAAYKSLQEISFAVLGMTLCLVAIYVPIVFMPQSMVATFAQEFAFTLAGAVLISGFIALTLTPMMCARVLRVNHSSSYEVRLKEFMHRLQERYQDLLTKVLMRQKLMFGGFIVFLGLTVFMYKALPTELLPTNELNYILGQLTGPSSANNDFMRQQIDKLVQEIKTKIPEVQNALVGNDDVGYVFAILQLKPSTWFGPTPDDINQKINTIIHNEYPNLNGGLSVYNANQVGGNNHQGNFYFYVNGLASYQEISKAAQSMVEALSHYQGVSAPVNGTQFNNQTIDLSINRDYATSLGVDINAINTAISTLFGGYTAETQYQVGGYGYPIVVQLPEDALQNFSILNTTYVKNSSGQLIPLSSLVSAKMALDLPYRTHVNLLRAGEVDANIAPGYTTGQVVAQVNNIAKNLPANLSVSFSDRIASFQSSINTMSLIFILGFMFIYLVLAALFESFIDPLIMLVGIPPCILGALFALWLMGGSLNIYTSISPVTLIGLVSKHGVLITQFSNQLRAEGLEITEAVKRAASIRLRPILMTSLTMILGALPLVFATGTDAFGRRQIGVVIVFGLVLGTFFSLFVVPVAYTLLAQFKHRFKH